jgi:hypothetical protein
MMKKNSTLCTVKVSSREEAAGVAMHPEESLLDFRMG